MEREREGASRTAQRRCHPVGPSAAPARTWVKYDWDAGRVFPWPVSAGTDAVTKRFLQALHDAYRLVCPLRQVFLAPRAALNAMTPVAPTLPRGEPKWD